MQLVSKQDNSCYIWCQQAFNDTVVIACCLVQYWQIFPSFLIKLKNMRNSENISNFALDAVR